MDIKHIKLNQTIGSEYNVPAELISKLYDLYKKESLGIHVWDCDSTSIQGTFYTGYTYDKYVTDLTEFFENLHIFPTGYYVYFEDKVVESMILNQLITLLYPDKNYEGVIENIELNNTGNSSLLGFRKIFNENTQIETFDELPHLSNVRALATGEFRNCANLRSVNLTNIEIISSDCFRSSYNLEYFNGQKSEKGSLNLPNLKYNGLGNYAFYSYKDESTNSYKGPKVKKILNLGNLETIPFGCFENCQSLESIEDDPEFNVLEKIKIINSSSFRNCTQFIINDLKLPLCTYIDSYAFYGCQVKKISELGLCTIRSYAFEGNAQLTEISNNALENIQKIENNVFNNCTNLNIADLSLPNLTSIGKNAFGNTKIQTISNLGSISTLTGFDNCTQLTYVEIPSTITALGESAFKGCVNLNINNILQNLNIKFFYNECLSDINSLPSIMYLPQVTSSIDYKAFNNTNIRSLYLPNMINTNGCSGTSVPTTSTNFHRGGSNIIKCGDNISIIYFKNLQNINTGTFGGRNFAEYQPIELEYSRVSNASDSEYQYHHIKDGKVIYEFSSNLQIPFGPKGVNADSQAGISAWANIKYLIINNINPPTSWIPYNNYGSGSSLHWFGPISLYGKKDSNGTQESFKYLVVPRSSINTYKVWNAFHPDLSSSNVSESDRLNYNQLIGLDANNDFNKIIALESMGHFATKADYDAAPDYPDGIHNKEEYLIEEFMGLNQGETINWDQMPTWSI